MLPELLQRVILRSRCIVSPVALVLILCFSNSGNAAAQLKVARFSAVFGSVSTESVLGGHRSAALNLIVGDNTTVRTGNRSRTELTFADQSIARLWEHTTVDLKDGGRDLFLQQGALFIDVTTGGALGSVRGAGVAVDVSGISALFEYHPKVFKLLVLNGTARLYRPDHVGDSVLVAAGQLVFGNPNTALSDPVDFDIKHFFKTSRFVSEFAPLRSRALIASEIEKQGLAKSKKVLMETNLVMYGGGTTVSATGGAPGKDSSKSNSTRGSGP